MNDQPFVHVMTYGSAHAAHVGKGALEAEGIQCRVFGDKTTTTHAFLGGSSQEVRLLVQPDQIHRALTILETIETETRGDRFSYWDTQRSHGWVCESCDEVNQPSFDECWSCESARPANPEYAPLPDSDNPAPRFAAIGSASAVNDEPDDSPYRVPKSLLQTPTRPVDAAMERRMFRAAIVGLIVPPVSLYSVYLMGRHLVAGHAFSAVFWLSATLIVVTFTMLLLWTIANLWQ